MGVEELLDGFAVGVAFAVSLVEEGGEFVF